MISLQGELARQKIFRDASGRRSFATFPLKVKRVAVLTDLTDESQAAVDYTVSLAEYFDARVTLLHVCPPGNSAEFFSGILTHTELFPGILTIGGSGNHRPNADLDLLRLQAEIRRRGPSCEACLRCGRYAEQAFAVAADRSADLLVVSEQHLNWFASFTEEDHEGMLLRGAPCRLVAVADQPMIAPCPQTSGMKEILQGED